ncbi:MAG: anti-sigma factor antagonist, partial [Candidatus Latescibacterota bacterium]
EPSHGADEPIVEYSFSTSNLDNAVDESRAITTLISDAFNLEDRIYYRLKLCIYELAVNSVEHGIFKSIPPLISCAVSRHDDQLRVCYKDNAEGYPENAFQDVHIEDKIKSKSKRGLGLFIMNRLAEDLRFERVGKENKTTFTIKGISSHPITKQGRITMDSFSIKLETCDIEDAKIVKPIGSIDSITTRNLEDQLLSLMDKRTKYIIVDFSEVNFISSAGIGVLLGTVSSLREDNGDLVFMKVPSQVKEIFDILNISDYFINVDNINELKETIKA